MAGNGTQNTQELQKLEGVVEHMIYENPETGYAVFEVDAQGTDIVVAGNVGSVDNGMSVVVYGHMTTHPNYGEQFRAETCEASLPQDTAATLSYLSSGALPYIGPSTAKKIVAKFGDDTLTVIAESPQQLCAIRGITPDKAEAISKEFKRMYGVREVVAWAAGFGLSAQNAVELYRSFGANAVTILQDNPYLLCGDPLNLKFSQVDAIAARLRFELDDRLRVGAGLLYAMRHNAGNGHTCLPRAKLLESTARFLRLEPDRVEEGLEGLLASDELRARTFDGTEYIYLPDLLTAEEDIAARLRELASYPTEPPKTLDSDIRVLEFAQGVTYAPLQKDAIRLALSSRIMVLTGGPGTGKTTTVNAILSLYEASYDRVSLCAPTGRAAKRLSELTGHKASTIHRLLEVDYTSGTLRFIHNAKNLLKCDVVILDEVSMVDVKLFQALLAALRPSCRIVLVGDADQLPSVGPGNILGEILRAGTLPTVRLNQVFRQAGQSLIVRNAHRIVNGQMPQKGGRDDDFFMIESMGLACQRLVCDLVATRLPQAYGFDPVRDIQVLCPTKVGPTGSVELNRRLQELLNPPGPGKPQIGSSDGGRVLRLGDKVMQIKNDYDITYERNGAEAGVGAYNGDMGIVTAVDTENRTVTVQMDDRRYTYMADQLSELEPAYAVTVHKSQGSEFPAVVLPAADVPARLCYRNLLYTGVTRARRLCVLVGSSRTERTMVDNVRQNLRFSGLRYFLKPAQGAK
ncbi:ATP-dependent RecD-like DNA helicase [Subdoligranulum sp. DSM 109015]|uniref:ATP-dependent RecD2 DNA helicase n=1 Tax=Gemmiger gallinarum TaxID=2779354 RepID=A0ABR9R082_9FIRM|nr:ATP-dependent RecD-like DNA helicase [Gemmiger gallinarum]MBE5036235.1 ATP-dependent RecD-like DNA helicase [Gemmiger gallinarum]